MSMVTNYFKYRREDGQNINSGFMSFQHFREDSLYSDCIVKPENNRTETENYECYPIPDDVEQNGKSEGFYPDTSIAYFRVLWKDWEPERGVYRYEFINDILNKTKKHNQTLIFRLMPHSTRAQDDVPEWLKQIMVCPERPEGKRIKDSPTDPMFIKLFKEAIVEFGRKFDTNPTLSAIDISLPGAWGEGHNLALYAESDLEDLFNAYIVTFKNTRVIGQISKPELIKKVSMDTASIGIRGDGFGGPLHIYNIYPPIFEELSNLWQTAPVSFESYWWLGEWKRQGWDIDELIQLSLKWHISSFNAKSLPIPYEWKDKIDYWISKMGYHFTIDYFKFPDKIQKGQEVEIKLGVDNVGVAPIYDKMPLYIKFDGETSWEFETNIDITKWLPGKSSERIILSLPEILNVGRYTIEICIGKAERPTVYFATDAERDGKYYKVGQIEILI